MDQSDSCITLLLLQSGAISPRTFDPLWESLQVEVCLSLLRAFIETERVIGPILAKVGLDHTARITQADLESADPLRIAIQRDHITWLLDGGLLRPIEGILELSQAGRDVAYTSQDPALVEEVLRSLWRASEPTFEPRAVVAAIQGAARARCTCN